MFERALNTPPNGYKENVPPNNIPDGFPPITIFAKTAAYKVSKYRVFSGPYFPVFGLNTEVPNTGKYGPEKTPYLDTFHAVNVSS